ncbi:MAG: hypothetical protein LBU79_01430 [Planctomycetota bacterium]|jgi:hypothetical protein|nr:hypothetical protein [Planctomycetota bacterium]
MKDSWLDEEGKATMSDNWGEDHDKEEIERSMTRGMAETILNVLSDRFGSVPADLREQITSCKNLAAMKNFSRQAGAAKSLDDLPKSL